jgi:hypothetical protein
VEGHSENHFTAQDFRQLTAELDRLGFFALEEFYTDFRTCHASTSIEVVLGGVTKRVVCEGGIQPDVWPEIIAAFRPALKLAEWREEPA